MDITSECSGLNMNRYSPAVSLSDQAPNCHHDDDWLPLVALYAGAREFGGMIVQSPQMENLLNTLTRVAPYKSAVLVQGESGTGKELVADALHRLGPMPTGPFVIFNCSNLIGPLADAQLFGHVRGAFTDAREDSLGYFRSANRGTLFLDEVGELPLQLQPKLLRVLETYEVQPVGSTKTHKTDVRIVAATNRDLRAMVKSGDFREDLYHRLTAISVHIPPLRERTDGKRALVAYFIGRGNRQFDKHVSLVSRRAMDLLEAHSWTGNVRELANVVQGAVMLGGGDRLCISDFPSLSYGVAIACSRPQEKSITTPSGSAPAEVSPCETRGTLDDEVISAETNDGGVRSLREAGHRERKKTLLRALNETGGNCSQTARLLGVSRFTIYRLLDRYGLVRTVVDKASKA